MTFTRQTAYGNANLIEQLKENIMPLNRGRSITKLVNALLGSSSSTLNTNHLDHKVKLNEQKDQFQKRILEADDSDDPLQAYIDYIDWIHYNYPHGANTENGLVILLEECTAKFRDIQNYKNDPRYLKVWMEYINYSDTPKDIFIYLAKKEIGTQLSLYYEEFATYLEMLKKLIDANQIYELGIQSNAYPLKRLQRSYNAFKERFDLQVDAVSSTSEVVREVLGLKRGSRIDIQESETVHRNKKPRHEVFKDNDQDLNDSILKSIFGTAIKEEHALNPTKQRIKENVISASTWLGQVLKQKVTSLSVGNKIPIFRDNNPKQPETKKLILIDNNNNNTYTLLETEGKKPEKVLLNMDLVYPDELHEYSFLELLSVNRSMEKARRLASTQQIQQPVLIDNYEDVVGDDDDDDDTKTITLALALNDTMQEKSRYGNEPTITVNGNIANSELHSIYNDIGQVYNFEEEEEKFPEPTVTDYEGFVTETIHSHMRNEGPANPEKDLIPTQVDTQQIDQIATPPTDIENSFQAHGMSSPFVHEPRMATQPIDPFDGNLQEGFLNGLNIPISTYAGFHDKSTITVNRAVKIRSITNKNQTINKRSLMAIIDYCGAELYCLLHELGKGGYGSVYLIEAASSGNLKALKIESPSNRWEFYILHQIHRRLIGEAQYRQNFFIGVEALYYFKDESFLVLDYCRQGTLLDVVNNYKNNGSLVDEVLVVFLTIELMKILESLHSANILHGDLKADNCMIRFESTDNDLWSEVYDRNGRCGWRSKSLTLIDFGRAVDLNLFSNGTRFISNFKTDEQDCPQMNEGKPWTYEADYFGLASIIHTLLFGSYIRVKKIENKIKLNASFKRYWQTNLWAELFDLLLNPYEENEHYYNPKTNELHRLRQLFEDWLEKNSKAKHLKSIIKTVETELNSKSKEKLG